MRRIFRAYIQCAVTWHVSVCVCSPVRCICGLLRNKCRILVTHQLQHLTTADQILVLREVGGASGLAVCRS